MSLKASFVSFLTSKYPSLSESQLSPLVSDELLSPFQITLSDAQIAGLKNEIKGYWNLREWGQKNLAEEYARLGLRIPQNYSVCMSYDFHINPEGRPELIEVNTNAAFLALGLEMYEFLQIENPVGPFDRDALVAMFREEMRLGGKTGNSISIIDENPEQQRMYIEFLVYRELFEKNGISTEVLNIDRAGEMAGTALTYNRYTDFFLQDEKSSEIKRLYNEGQIQLSPNPYEYFLLADKQRLLDWNRQSEVPRPESLLKIYDLGTEDKEKIWAGRKGLFFKPKNSFGGKQAYRGASMAHKAFESVFNANFVAQQMSVPSHINVEYKGAPLELKYDLRCFVYQDEIQLMIARLYQGQITNLKTPGGGFAAVRKA